MSARIVDPDIVRLTDQVGAAHGFDLGPALAGAGLSHSLLALPDLRLTAAQACAFLAGARDISGRADLGLIVGAGQTVTSWGVLGLAMLSASSLELAVRTGMTYRALAGALTDIETRVGASGLSLVVRPYPELASVERFVVEELFASVVGLLRVALGPAIAVRAEFAFAAPQDPALARELFGDGVRHDREVSSLILSRRLLDRPLPTTDPLCHRRMTELLDAQLAARRGVHGLVGQVEDHVRGRLAMVPTMARTAAVLHLSERTLRRRLAEAGTTFQGIVDAVRRERAYVMLINSDSSLPAIARACGLGDERSLRRAVQRWFGRSASALRTPDAV